MPQIDNHVLRIDFAGDPNGAGFEHWREEIGRGFVKIDIGPVKEGPVVIQTEFHVFPGVVVGRGKGTASRYERTKDLAKDGRDDFVLTVPLRTPLQVFTARNSFALGSGASSLTETTEPHGMYQSSDGEFYGVSIARHRLRALCPEIEDRMNAPLRSAQSAGRLLRQYLEIITQPNQQWDSVTKAAAGQHVIDLIAIMAGATKDAANEAQQRGVAAARLAAIKEVAASNASRADFSLGEVARQQNVSERYIQILFSQEQTTFSDYLREQRLLLAHRLLCDPRNAVRKVSDIAYSAGFGDISHFNRNFRTRFGLSPAEARAQMLKA